MEYLKIKKMVKNFLTEMEGGDYSVKAVFPSFSPKRRALRDRWEKTDGISWDDYLRKNAKQVEMGDHYLSKGWARGTEGHSGDYSTFFDHIGEDELDVATTAFTGNDIYFFDSEKVKPMNGGFVKI